MLYCLKPCNYDNNSCRIDSHSMHTGVVGEGGGREQKEGNKCKFSDAERRGEQRQNYVYSLTEDNGAFPVDFISFIVRFSIRK